MPRKRKTLVKEFDELLEAGDLDALKAVYDECELNAVTGSRKNTALALRNTPPELMRWLIEQGLDVNTENRFGKTALAEHATLSDIERMKVLLECGADVEAGHPSPLLHAAGRHQPEVIVLLLEHGADIDGENRRSHERTPINEAIACADPMDVPRRVFKSIDVLLDAGAEIDDETREECTKFGRRFNRSTTSIRRKYQKDMDRLYERTGATPPTEITLHDGHSDIVVPKDKSIDDQFRYLWNNLIPYGGAAKTVQGEVIRIVGRIGYEALEMGYINWDEEFVKMADYWLETVGAAEDAIAVVKRKKAYDDEIDELTEAAVKWVEEHPMPIELGEVDYTR
ncbi:MAG: ankyrin repeat domain-containing protein [Corynebacterium sp.]|nr:ankyrin repeat domain-containing protein [Corynebacterium sp.]